MATNSAVKRSTTDLTPLRRIETVREVLNITKDSVTVNKESLVVFSSMLLLKTSLTTLSAPAQFQGYLGSVPDLFLWKRNILYYFHCIFLLRRGGGISMIFLPA